LEEVVDKQDECHVEEVVKRLDQEALSDAMTAYLAVWGMGCPRCALRVRNSLLGLDGVLLAIVVLERCMAVVAYDPHRVDTDKLLQAVSAAGNDGCHNYQAKMVALIPATVALCLARARA
jgi:copper chaperone CopZ